MSGRDPSANGRRHVLIVGGGFAGVGCARRLAKHDDVHVTLVDRNNYHQFQPLLYQVATCQLASSDIAHSLRKLFRDDRGVDVKLDGVASVDTAARAVVTDDGRRLEADALVLAAGSQPNFFRTPGAEEHASRCTRSTTPRDCGRGSSPRSRTPRGIRRSSSAAR